jgi:hypothetical protein
MQGRADAMNAIAALRGFMPGCESAKLRNFGMTLGIRDTRKIDAAYNITGGDVRSEARFEDSIGIFPEFIDGYGLLILPTTGRYFHVPYRSLLPKGIANLLVCGRVIGGDKVSHAAVRNMMCCAVSGQGAGAAAAISVRNTAPRGVSIKAMTSSGASARTCWPCGPLVVGGQFQSAAVHMDASVAPRPQPTTQSRSMSSSPVSDFCLIQLRTASISPRSAA